MVGKLNNPTIRDFKTPEGEDERVRGGEQSANVVLDIVYDVTRTFSGACARRRRERTLFYRVVRGGDHVTAGAVLDTLEQKHMDRELEWLLALEARQNVSRMSRHGVMNVVALLLCVPVFVALTPVFYICHCLAGLVESRSATGEVMPESVGLPMAQAALSESRDMIAMFHRRGVPLTQQDALGNNVFHVLVSLSKRRPALAVSVYRLLRDVHGDGDLSVLRHTLMRQRNRYHLSALEAAVREGTPAMFRAMLDTEGVLRTTVLSAGVEGTRLASKSPAVGTGATAGGRCAARSHAPRLQLAYYDVTMYERGSDFRKQSFLLHQLTNQDVEGMDAEDVRALFHCPLLERWVRAKVSTNKVATVIRKLWNVLVMCALLGFLFTSGGDQDFRPMEAVLLGARTDVVHDIAMSSGLVYKNGSNATSWADVCTPRTLDKFNITVDSCDIQALKLLSEACPHHMTFDLLLRSTGLLPPLVDVARMFQYGLVLTAMFGGELVVDLTLRLLFLLQCFSRRDGDPRAFFRRLCSRRLPGSYVQRQLGVASAGAFFLYVAVLETTIGSHGSGHSEEEVAFRRVVVSVRRALLLLCLMLRFIDVLFSLRLVAAVGHYVITTFRMAASLAAFLIVYAFVLIPFSIIFYILMRDPSCRAYKLPQFSTLASSAMETYKLMFGHGDFLYDVYDDVKLAYVVYSVVTILLVLNLIIAVMNTVAAIDMCAPWRDALYRMEHLSEALQSEAAILALTYPWRQRLHLARLETAASCVLHRHPELKIYFEVEHSHFDDSL